MKIAVRTVLFHFLCIIVFAIVYYNIQSQFQGNNSYKKETFLDYIFLSTTIQASVGMSDIYPITSFGKIVMILQQLIMIMTHVFTLYIFNL
jgi:hypothetical protein